MFHSIKLASGALALTLSVQLAVSPALALAGDHPTTLTPAQTTRLLESARFQQALQSRIQKEGYTLLGPDRRETDAATLMRESRQELFVVTPQEQDGQRAAVQFKYVPAQDGQYVDLTLRIYDYHRNPQLAARDALDGRTLRIPAGEDAARIQGRIDQASRALEDTYRSYRARLAAHESRRSTVAPLALARLASSLIPSAHAGETSGIGKVIRAGFGIVLLFGGAGLAGWGVVMIKNSLTNAALSNSMKAAGTGLIVLGGGMILGGYFTAFPSDGGLIEEIGSSR